MSSYERYDSRRRRPLNAPSTSARRSTLGYWVPLVLTVGVATAGIVAWIWSERQDGRDDEDDADNDRGSDFHDKEAKRNSSDNDDDDDDTHTSDEHRTPGLTPDHTPSGQDEGFFSRMSGAVRRSPSPQQFLDSAGQRLAAGVAAAGAVVGLHSIREEALNRPGREDGFSDHERWNEEAETRRVEAQIGSQSQAPTSRQPQSQSQSQSTKAKARRSVAIVVSAEASLETPHHDYSSERGIEHAVRFVPPPYH